MKRRCNFYHGPECIMRVYRGIINFRQCNIGLRVSIAVLDMLGCFECILTFCCVLRLGVWACVWVILCFYSQHLVNKSCIGARNTADSVVREKDEVGHWRNPSFLRHSASRRSRLSQSWERGLRHETWRRLASQCVQSPAVDNALAQGLKYCVFRHKMCSRK